MTNATVSSTEIVQLDPRAGTALARPMAAAALQSRAVSWCLLMVLCAVWFYALASRTLVPTDEGRYAQIASEMAATGDFITMRLNGIKYFGKPPLQAWMNALTFRLFGFGEWQARLWTSMCGLFGVLAVFQAGRKLFSHRTGFTAALVLGSSFYWTAAGHVNSYDMSLSAMMALALCALLLAQRESATSRERRRWMLVCWAGMALAVMSKGLVGIVLPGAVLVLYTLASRDRGIWKRLHVVQGVLVFAALTLPWFILVSIQNPEFPHFFFVREHFGRFTSNVHLRQQPWYYFVLLALLGIMPWLGVLGQSLRKGAHAASAGFQPSRLLLIWVAFILFFFSLSRAKLPSYILPIFPALALLIADYLDSASHRAIVVSACTLGMLGAVLLALLLAAPAFVRDERNLELFRASAHWFACAALIAFAGCGLAAWLASRHRELALAALAAASFLATQMLILGHEPFGRHKAGVMHLPAIQAELAQQTPIYAVGAYEYVLPFYLRRTMIMVDRAEDGMRLGLQKEPHLWMPTLDAFVTEWRTQYERGKKAIAFVRPDIYSRLQEEWLPMRIIARDRWRVIVANDTRE